MPTYEVKFDKDFLDRIAVAETMHNFVLQAVPQAFKSDTDEKTIIVALLSLVIEHHGAILTLLKAGRFDGSAFALVRPLIDASTEHFGFTSVRSRSILRQSAMARALSWFIQHG